MWHLGRQHRTIIIVHWDRVVHIVMWQFVQVLPRVLETGIVVDVVNYKGECMNKEVTLEVPLALQQLIKANNKLLKTYQTQLLKEVEDANVQMMSILQLNIAAGWVLDMERMVYTRQPDEPSTETEPQE